MRVEEESGNMVVRRVAAAILHMAGVFTEVEPVMEGIDFTEGT